MAAQLVEQKAQDIREGMAAQTATDTSDEELHYAKATGKHKDVRHFVNLSPTQRKKNPRVLLLKMLRETVIRYKKWSNRTDPHHYQIDGIKSRAAKRQTHFRLNQY